MSNMIEILQRRSMLLTSADNTSLHLAELINSADTIPSDRREAELSHDPR